MREIDFSEGWENLINQCKTQCFLIIHDTGSFQITQQPYKTSGKQTLLDRGEAAVKELSMTKAYAVQVGYKAVDRAMQTHGAMGFTNELGLYQAWHALRIVNVADGTNEILNRTIAQRLLKGDRDL